MQLLVVVLNEIEKLDDLLLELSNNGINGGTVIDTMGMAKTLAQGHHDIPIIGPLKSLLLHEDRPINKTIFMVLPDEKVDVAMNCVRKIIPNLCEENVGIMFTLPIIKTEGLTK